MNRINESAGGVAPLVSERLKKSFSGSDTCFANICLYRLKVIAFGSVSVLIVLPLTKSPFS
jgi:hypothetical protein